MRLCIHYFSKHHNETHHDSMPDLYFSAHPSLRPFALRLESSEEDSPGNPHCCSTDSPKGVSEMSACYLTWGQLFAGVSERGEGGDPSFLSFIPSRQAQ